MGEKKTFYALKYEIPLAYSMKLISHIRGHKIHFFFFLADITVYATGYSGRNWDPFTKLFLI